MQSSEKMARVFELAVQELERVFSNEKSPTDKTKMAVSSIGIYSRLKSQENARLSLQYRVVKDLSENKKELEEYIKLTAPEMHIKRLPKKK